MSIRVELGSPDETREFGRLIGTVMPDASTLAIIGDLGAGKTTLSQGVVAGAGVSEPVTSPTYTLIHEYRGDRLVVHIDAYRLDRPGELFELGLQEYLLAGALVIVEWADRVADVLPQARLEISLSEPNRSDSSDSDTRIAAVEVLGNMPAAIAESIRAWCRGEHRLGAAGS